MDEEFINQTVFIYQGILNTQKPSFPYPRVFVAKVQQKDSEFHYEYHNYSNKNSRYSKETIVIE